MKIAITKNYLEKICCEEKLIAALNDKYQFFINENFIVLSHWFYQRAYIYYICIYYYYYIYICITYIHITYTYKIFKKSILKSKN